MDGLNLEIYHDYRMSFEELYMSMFEEDQEYIDDIFETENDYTLENLYNSSVDIYTEGSTGVTLMVPSNTHLTANRNEYGTYLGTSSPGGSISMHFYISPGYDMDQGMQTMQNFKYGMQQAGYNMTPHPDDIEDYRYDDYNPYYSEFVSQEFYNEYNEVVADFTGEIMINDGDFLAIIIVVADWERLEKDPNELHFLYLMESCAQFSDFAYY